MLMSKTTADKVEWPTVDKRIRRRKGPLSAKERREMEAALSKVPDAAECSVMIDIEQPAIASAQSAEEGTDGDGGSSAHSDGDGAAGKPSAADEGPGQRPQAEAAE